MQLTKEMLKKIIKEELEAVVQEEEGLRPTEEQVEVGIQMAKQAENGHNPIFDMLRKDPKGMKAVEQVAQELEAMNEQQNKKGEEEMAANTAFSGMLLGAAGVASNTGLVTAAMAGKAGMALAGTIGGVIGAVGTAGLIFATPVAIGFLIDYMIHKNKQKK